MTPQVLTVIGVALGCCVNAMAQSIPTGYQQVAAEYAVPPEVLYAVALTESGQSARSGGEWRPWPWTLNVAGEGRYFASREQAWQVLEQALSESGASVDIGLMQVNWFYHRRALVSTWQALDPYHNLRVAAAILRDCHDIHDDWLRSAGCYHSPNHLVRAESYAQRVQRHLDRLRAGPGRTQP